MLWIKENNNLPDVKSVNSFSASLGRFPKSLFLVACASLLPDTYFVIGNIQLVPMFAKSGNAYCGNPALAAASFFGSSCVKPDGKMEIKTKN